MIIYNAKKRPNSVFLKFSFLFWPVLLLIVFFFFFSPDKGNSIKADFDSFANYDSKAAYIVMKNIARKLSQSLKSTDDNLVKLATALYIAVQH